MTGRAVVIRGDATRLPLADQSVDLIVTSPPYYALRSYQDSGAHYDGQIGSEPTPTDYIATLIACTREWTRVLKPTGSVFVNLGDKYASGTGYGDAWSDRSTLGGGRRRPPQHGRAVSDGARAKSLLLLPERYRVACVDQLGLIARAVIVWSKPNGLPESVVDRVRRSHEDWIHLVSQPRYYSAVDELREETHRIGLTWAERKETGARTHAPDNGQMSGGPGMAAHPLGRLPGSVWEIPTEPLIVPEHLGVDHFAAFPTDWPRRLIIGWSPPGICANCGEGRRPVGVDSHEYQNHRARTGDFNKQNYLSGLGYVGQSGAKRVGKSAAHPPDRARRIVGYVCACTPYTDHPERRGTSWHDHVNDAVDGQSKTRAQTEPRLEVREYHFDQWTPAPTRPAVILDPFGGTGTTALVAKALGRIGITVDRSADYCRLARWRTTDRRELAKAMRVQRPDPVPVDQLNLFDEEALGGD